MFENSSWVIGNFKSINLRKQFNYSNAINMIKALIAHALSKGYINNYVRFFYPEVHNVNDHARKKKSRLDMLG